MKKKRTKEIYSFIKRNIHLFIFENWRRINEIFLKSDVILLTCVSEKIIKVSANEFDINPIYSVSLPGYTWQCGLKNADIK